jgi:hypothetical protein
MADNQVSRPSDMTIQAFVNSSTELNLPAISKPNDVAYVVYQKTGFLNNQLQNITTSNLFNDTTNDIVNFFAPIFIIWKLTHLPEGAYVVDNGFPKFVRAQTNNSQDAFNPQTWSTY